MTRTAFPALLAAFIAQPVLAQDGAYFGAGIGITDSASAAEIFPDNEASGTEAALALTAGYRFAGANGLSYGIEGNLDIQAGGTMSFPGRDACTDFSPTWCAVDTVFRVRGTLGTTLATGDLLMASVGGVMVKGTAEDGPGNYVDTTGTGLSLGLSWQSGNVALPVRVDLNFDRINSDDADLFDRDLDLIGLRVSYMF